MCCFAINGIDYCLGTSTVQDLVMNGWAYTVENDGTYAFYDPEFESYFYVVASAGAADDPIVIIDLMWADGVPAAYCGFVADQEAEGNENALMKWLMETLISTNIHLTQMLQLSTASLTSTVSHLQTLTMLL